MYAVDGGEHQPRVAIQRGEREIDRFQGDRRQFDHLRAELLEAGADLARLLAGARYDDAPAEQGSLLEPCEIEARDRADDDRAGGLDTELIDRLEGRAHRALLGSRPPPNGGDRRGRVAAARDERLR